MKMGNFSIVLLYGTLLFLAGDGCWENRTVSQAKMQLLEPPERPFTLGDPGFKTEKDMDVSEIVVPQNGWSYPIKMDDLGVPLFLETPICQRVGKMWAPTSY